MIKILVAEDDLISQKTASAYIEKMGHVAFISPNGKHAFEALCVNDDIKILVTDFMMPKMDGRKLIKTVRSEPKFSAMPIIIMSGIIGVNEISDLLEIGATFFIPKPLKRVDFEQYINRCVNLIKG
ncbi:MAG: response regulator [Chitinivibrionales bacterium]|nr:response regulator [Chitinivibrionales bacterium]